MPKVGMRLICIHVAVQNIIILNQNVIIYMMFNYFILLYLFYFIFFFFLVFVQGTAQTSFRTFLQTRINGEWCRLLKMTGAGKIQISL